ncbi:MAG: hypothetical protein KKB59_18785 [Spirochaetes bacterium]|nr:hypothetical protein [Spirochaetota bacterium]
MGNGKTTVIAYAMGGLGDLILALDGIRNIREIYGDDAYIKCLLMSHSDSAKDLVAASPGINEIEIVDFNFDVKQNFKKIYGTESGNSFFTNAIEFQTTIFPRIYTTKESKEKAKLAHESIKKIFGEQIKPIVIHLCGSRFSNYFLSQVSKVGHKDWDFEKWDKLIHMLLEYDKNIVICLLGSEDDKLVYKEKITKHERMVEYFDDFNILDSIDFLQMSKLCIGVDSAIKSFSLAMKIPTVVLVNDHEDPVRDKRFLDPYEKSNEVKCHIIRKANTLTPYDVFDGIPKEWL